ncbi:hypothetical protein [Alienimonas chondri]|uniref:Uncharacterized protein n=1 Tax=Alienimonas chondri TaxID=2681879 RepID=A0ABX1VHL4_9PLAN|nr:hypothetical protein [Alienimonas chondri]NNJ27599.1 hypothetical protein [Alienimonas chondri]
MPSLFVLTAADADRAVILRRGPSKWFHVIAWDTARDSFEHGAWLKGNIWRPYCALSADGELLLAAVWQYQKRDTSFTEGWTALSRAPWLKALTLWPNRRTMNLGGWFDGPRSIVLRTTRDEPPDWHPAFPPRGVTVRHVDPTERSPYPPPPPLVAKTDWSGRDHSGGLIFTRGGRLFRLEKGEDRLIADFTDLTPDPQPAPDWAGRPL